MPVDEESQTSKAFSFHRIVAWIFETSLCLPHPPSRPENHAHRPLTKHCVTTSVWLKSDSDAETDVSCQCSTIHTLQLGVSGQREESKQRIEGRATLGLKLSKKRRLWRRIQERVDEDVSLG